MGTGYNLSVVRRFVSPLFGYLGKAFLSCVKKESLGDRMKRYESTTTDFVLSKDLPVYIRLDMRAGHTFCRGLVKPFDVDYSSTMRETTKYLVEKTGAILGYTQSDEISLVYENPSKIPFETRLFKLESVIASMASSSFVLNGIKTKLKDRIENGVPSFDCRVMNLPSMEEAANMILWRVRDSIKNSITLVALSRFSNSEIHKKNGDEKIDMLRERGVDYYSYAEGYRYGFFFRRENYTKVLTEEEISKIPRKNLPEKNGNGEYVATRRHIVEFGTGIDPNRIKNRAGVFFYREAPETT